MEQRENRQRAAASEQPTAAPEARQPKNWRLVLQQIIDCRDERDKVLMIAQDALNMSQPEPQDTELRERIELALEAHDQKCSVCHSDFSGHRGHKADVVFVIVQQEIAPASRSQDVLAHTPQFRTIATPTVRFMASPPSGGAS